MSAKSVYQFLKKPVSDLRKKESAREIFVRMEAQEALFGHYLPLTEEMYLEAQKREARTSKWDI